AGARAGAGAVAAGPRRPPQSVYPNVRDLEGLAASCRRGRAFGHLGRAAIHPDQLPVIEHAYLPTLEEVERARETIERLEAGVGAIGDGGFGGAGVVGAPREDPAVGKGLALPPGPVSRPGAGVLPAGGAEVENPPAE